MITENEKFELDHAGALELKLGLGSKLLGRKPNVIRARYDFATQGGAVGAINLLEKLSDSNSLVKIPDNAIIKLAILDILTAMSSTGDNGTIAIASEGAGDLLATVDADTLSGISAGVPVGTAATMIKMTAERTLIMTVATNALLTGKFDLLVEYYLGN